MKAQSLPDRGYRVPRETHWWNFWVCGTEAALFMTATRIMGPMTMIPFLFKKLSIDDAWLGLFSISALVMAVANPLGTALAGGKRYKLPYCLKIGILQRLPFLFIPLGTMFFYTGPETLLVLLVVAWFMTHFFLGMTQPVFQVVITNGINEDWWARMLSLRNILAAVAGIGATVLVWWVNDAYSAPTNYIILGWSGVVLLTLSFVVVSQIREVPMDRELPHGWEHLRNTFGQISGVLREDGRVRWIVVGRIFRTCGFLLGTYMTAVCIERCGLGDEDMYLPFVIMTGAQIVSYGIAGWFIDHLGVKPALVLSSLSVGLNSVLIMRADSLAVFAVVFSLGVFSGSLLMSAWTPLVLKLAPMERRPMYMSAVMLSSAPGTVAVLLAGVFLVRTTGFDYVFYVSGIGGLLGAAVFLWKVPHLRYAPSK